MQSLSASEVVSVYGRRLRAITTIVSASAQASLEMTPDDSVGLGDERIAMFSDMYRFYRFTKLKIQFYRTTDASLAFVGIMTGSGSTAPTTLIDAMDMNVVALQWQHQTTCGKVVLGRKDLKGQLDWYLTEDDGGEDTNEQGRVFFSEISENAAFIAGKVIADISYEIEFKERLNPAVTMDRYKKKHQDMDFDEVLDDRFNFKMIDDLKNKMRSSTPLKK